MSDNPPDATDVAAAIRRGTPDDIRACSDLLWASITDFAARQGTPLEGTAEAWWQGEESLHRLLATLPGEWWVAEGANEELVGYARSLQRGDMAELTEFFVRPGHQSKGLGRALLKRAFPDRGGVRSIIATGEPRALGRYYKAGCVARFPILSLAGSPQPSGAGEDLRTEPVGVDEALLAEIARVERAVLGHDRGAVEFEWLVRQREAYLYRRGDRAVGYGFISRNGAGPIAALDPTDLPAILTHIEGRAHALGLEKLDLQVPSPNVAAMTHLLARGYRIDPWINYLMSDRPFGQFDRFLGFGPPIFL